MGAEFTFFDYKDDIGGSLHEWFKAQPAKVRAKFTQRLSYLEATPPGQWTRPYVDTLDEECAGLFEVRVRVQGVQYRVLGCHGPGQCSPTLLHGFIKPNDEIDPAECGRAHRRKERVDADPDKFRELHRYV